MASPQGPRAAPEPAREERSRLSDVDWLALCRRVVEKQHAIFSEHAGIASRTEYEGRGEGGDWTLVIDRLAEDVVFAELEALAAAGHGFVAVSEERGEVELGGGGQARVVIDPIDGSLNARRTIPSFSVSIAVASGDSMADVEVGYVYDFGTGEEFVARRGEGATLGGVRLEAAQTGDRVELVGLEAVSPELAAPILGPLRGKVFRFRSIGSIAISLCYVAAGRLDGMIGLRDSRSVDAAAGQLIAREAGADVAFAGFELEEAPLGLDARYPMLAAGPGQGLEILLRALAEAGRDD